MTLEEKFNFLRDKIIYVINHYGIANTDGLISFLEWVIKEVDINTECPKCLTEWHARDLYSGILIRIESNEEDSYFIVCKNCGLSYDVSLNKECVQKIRELEKQEKL